MNPKSEAFVFMKVGQHAGEDFDSIIQRKIKEIETTGMSFWGYGGPTCHPTNQIQPFAKHVIEKKGTIYLCMEKIKSFTALDVLPATMFSIDGIKYDPIPEGIKVVGSRYAIVLDEIVPEKIEIPLSSYEVAYGKSHGRLAVDYIKGHVDKACLEFIPERLSLSKDESHIKTISYVAKMKEPFAVFVR